MLMYNNNIKVRAREGRLSFIICHLSFSLALLGLSASCSDWRDGIAPDGDDPSLQGQAIAFQATVNPSQTVTRADGSLINRLETSLFETKDRSYWTVDDDGSITEKQRQYSVGLFAANTGTATWSETAAPTANFMFNQKMNIAKASDGRNALTYAPAVVPTDESKPIPQDSLRFWPNDDSHLSFWAYYPYNQTSDPGEYGISITTASNGVGQGKGMGAINFTMHPDAAEQNDFMLSDLVADGQKSLYPLLADGKPKPVPLRFHHMLAQVRLYAFIRGEDKVVYYKGSGSENLTVTSISGNTVTFSDGSQVTANPTQYIDEWGRVRNVEVGCMVPDDTPWLNVASPLSVRWNREIEGNTGEKQFEASLYQAGDKVIGIDGYPRAQTTLQMSFNNIHTKCAYTPHVTQNSDGTYTTSLTQRDVDYEDLGTLGSATVKHYIQNPYWFYFDEHNNRVMLNPRYMYDYFEDTPAYKGTKPTDDSYEEDWSTKFGEDSKGNYLNYHLLNENADPDDARGHKGWHFNYAPGNILLCVPQVKNDNDVPHIIITATGKRVRYVWDSTNGWGQEDVGSTAITGKVTINMLNMNLKWEPGFIYCYAFIDELKPGDDKVRGPETITVVFDPTKQTDQW